MGVGFGFVDLWFGFLRKIRPTQLWVELSWVVAISTQATSINMQSSFKDRLTQQKN